MRTTLRSVIGRLREADLSQNAAAVAFHTFLAIVPLTLALLGVGAVIGTDQAAVARVEEALDPVAPRAVTDFVVDLLVDADRRLGAGDWWLIALSVAAALLLGSRAIVALQRALAAIEHRIDVRDPVPRRVVGIALTVAGGFSLIITGTLLVAGRSFFAFLAGWLEAPVLDDVFVWLRLPLAGAGLFAFLLACYHFAPPEPVQRPFLASAVATGGVIAGSLGFAAYLDRAPELGAAFGALGAVAVALVWLYLGAAAILAGAVVSEQTS